MNNKKPTTARSSFKAWACAGVAFAALVAASPAVAQPINTMGQWNGTQFISSWGVPNTQTYGQTITATPTQSLLTGFTFQLFQTGGTPAQYQAFVYRWDAATQRITGPALYGSGILTAPSGAAFTPVSISTGNVALTPGQQYVLFLSTSNGAQVASAYRYGATPNTAYAGGQFVFQNNGADFGNLSTASWSTIAIDLAMIVGLGSFNFGQNAIGFQQSGIQLMNGFLSLLLDPFADTRGGLGLQGGPLGFAAEAPAATSAYAQAFKAPVRAADPRPWNIWAAGYGGYNRTDGDPAIATSDLTARGYGYAVGLDYRVSPGSTIGFAVAGGHTSWGVGDALGGGSSDAFQVGGFATHSFGQAYVSGAIAAAFHSVDTDRTVLATTEVLKGDFNAFNLAFRAEGGYRFGTSEGAITPYVAAQIQSLHVNAFTETSNVVASINVINYSDRSVNAPRTEVGARFDKRFMFSDQKAITLFGRLAWAHDYNNTRDLLIAFQGLPGTPFTVFGAGGADNLALVTAGAEVVSRGGWSALAKFDGEFGDNTQTYSATGKVRFRW